MDPDSGKFQQITPANPAPEDWPKFRIGEVVEVKGVPFEITRIRVTSIVLRPVVAGQSALQAMTRLTR